MKPHQRRESGKYPYYKIAKWDTRSMTWRDGKTAFATEEEAILSIPPNTPANPSRAAGRYRVSVVTADGRIDKEPFEVGSIGPGD